MVKNLLSTLILVCFATTVWGQTSLEGKVTDGQTGEAILFGTVSLFKNGSFITGTETDLDGNYVFSNMVRELMMWKPVMWVTLPSEQRVSRFSLVDQTDLTL